MSKQEEIKQALAAASTEHEWDTDGTFIQWKDGHVLQGTYRQIAITEAPNPEVFDNPNHENDANLIAKAPEYLAYLLAENDRLRKELEEKEREAEQWRSKYVSKVNLLRTTDDSRNELDRMYRGALEAAHGFQQELEEAKEVLRWYSAPEFYEAAHKLTEGVTHVLDDCGARARAYLVGQEGEGNQ